MIHKDTVRLLRECDAGVKMGVAAIADVMDRIQTPSLSAYLGRCQKEHRRLGAQIRSHLSQLHDRGKDPSPVLKQMSRLKTRAGLAFHASDHKVADIMTDGCNMGIKSLSKYLNQYAAADEKAKALTQRLIGLEENMAHRLRQYL